MTLHLVNIWLISCQINSAVHKAVTIFLPLEKGIVACTAAEGDDGAHGTHGSIVQPLLEKRIFVRPPPSPLFVTLRPTPLDSETGSSG